jgi:hypothetical protein
LTGLLDPLNSRAMPREIEPKPEPDTTEPDVDDAMLASALAALREAVSRLPDRLRVIADARTRFRPGGWTRREELGHLIDSALNNLHRFVRLQDGDLRFPGYEADAWVARGGHDSRPWSELVEEWTALNRHAVHLVSRMPRSALRHRWLDGDGATLAWLVVDYERHLRHHLGRILA